MCSNYIPASGDSLRSHFQVTPPDNFFKPESYPGYLSPIIRLDPDNPQHSECVPACFGMVPAWADLKLAKHTYNARSETVASKPTFRNAYKKRQFAIIPAEAFFEPNYETGKAVRWRIGHADEQPLGIAGIWEFRSKGPNDQPLISFSMLTINADEHPLMHRFHKPADEKRMIVILRPEEYMSWLSAPLEQVPSFLAQFPPEELYAHPDPKPGVKRTKHTPLPSERSLF
jgi:putative SOS response-associated peptidase YedK